MSTNFVTVGLAMVSCRAARLAFSGLAVGWFACLGPVQAADRVPGGTNEVAQKAWQALTQAGLASQPPADWQKRQPTPEEVESFRRQVLDRTHKVADLAQEFYTRFPADANAIEARKREVGLLSQAWQMGDTNCLPRLREREDACLKDPRLPEADRFRIRHQQIMRGVREREQEDESVLFSELERGLRVLLQEFPRNTEIYGGLLVVAENSDTDKGRALVREILQSAASDDLKESARGLSRRFDMIGQPLKLRFTAVDGREVDLEKLRGKVVLVDFWATWCGPCVAELPNLKAIYERFQPKGFEILGVSLDHEKRALEKYVAKEQIRWPQYSDGLGWETKLSLEFAIKSIPTLWLVDRKGVLRDLQARQGLAAKVEALLAEAP